MTMRHEVIKYIPHVEYHFFDSQHDANVYIEEHTYSKCVYHYRDWHPRVEAVTHIIPHGNVKLYGRMVQ